MGIDQFIEEWTERHPDQVEKQLTRFLNHEGIIAANYVISYEQLTLGLSYVASQIACPKLLAIPHENWSNLLLTRDSLESRHLSWISHKFLDDFIFIERYCDRIINTYSSSR